MVDAAWWQRGVIYQLYLRSWLDTDGDGVGDLRGIASRLDYLTWLGVDAIWLSPIYPSPMVDFGYDVTDYVDVDPRFGSLADFDRLLAAAHRRGLRVILDWVPNHTSDQHPWFVESRASRDSPKRDWYVWRDPAPGGGPPTNWLNYTGHSAWRFDERTGQYYYRIFLDQQPDLNWRNPAVREVMFDTLRFWLARGVDGFRIDVLSGLIEDGELRDNPRNPAFRKGLDFPYMRDLSVYNLDRPETRDLASQIRRVADEFGDDRVLLGELALPVEQLVAYHGSNGDGIQLPFNFALLTAAWDARGIAEFVDRYLTALPPGAWPNWVMGNHDVPRVATRVGPAQARVAAMLLLTLRGTPTLYYGDEIGMRDVPIPAERALDPVAGLIPGRGRDPERTPMQWEAGPGGGFTTGTPWLPLAADHDTVNVAAQRDDPSSILTLYRRLLRLRRRTPALVTGEYEPVQADGDVLAYVRAGSGRRWLVALNLGAAPGRLAPPGMPFSGRVVVATHPDRDGDAIRAPLTLRADEGLLIALA